MGKNDKYVDVEIFGKADITYQCQDGSLLFSYKNKSVLDFQNACSYCERLGYYLYSSADRNGNLSATYIKGAWEVRMVMEKWPCTKEILIQDFGQYVRAWGTTFVADAPLSIPDYTR